MTGNNGSREFQKRIMEPDNMRPRILAARFINRLGGFIQSLSLMVMKSRDLVDYSRRYYLRSQSVDSWSNQDLLDSGLNPEEEAYLDEIPIKKGSLLLLGLGGGRDAIPLAKRGFKVTGVDFVEQMVEKAKENARRNDVVIEGMVGEITDLRIDPGSFDLIWFSTAMYSTIPTRRKRIDMLKRMQQLLKPEGVILCQFYFDFEKGSDKGLESLKRVFSYITLGNTGYEKGDILWGNAEFIHLFLSREELVSEFKAAGFEVDKLYFHENSLRGAAILMIPS